MSDTTEAARVNADADITRALIEQAGLILSTIVAVDAKDRSDEDRAAYSEAQTFLKGWYVRKQPAMEGMPKL